ncbi:MAG: acyl-ACP--UDP-N-acetylglucosamine O-acyltransferase [Alphaproteobacteria bacterium]
MDSQLIHPTAIIHPNAKIGKNVKIGPYCSVGEHVELADNVQLISHVVVDGRSSIGEGTKIYPFSTIGLAPQDLKYHGEESRLEIGKNNSIREHVTIHLGTEGGGMLTKIGDNNLLMVGVHIAHDCHVGNQVVMANNATIAGHVQVEDFVVIGGLSAVHQFVRLGAHSMIGGMSGSEKDVIPFGTVMGTRASLGGMNLVGMRRRGFDKTEIHAVRHFFDLLKTKDTLQNKLEFAEKQPEFIQSQEVQRILTFMKADSSRQYMMPTGV